MVFNAFQIAPNITRYVSNEKNTKRKKCLCFSSPLLHHRHHHHRQDHHHHRQQQQDDRPIQHHLTGLIYRIGWVRSSKEESAVGT